MSRLYAVILMTIVAVNALFAATTLAADKQTTAPIHPADPETAGRLLLSQLSCTTCHAASQSQAQWLAPQAAPKLAEIGNRASPKWIEQYLALPDQTMPGTTMPDVLGALPPAERLAAAGSLTHFLLSQRAPAFKRIRPDRGAVVRGENLYHRVGCVACHAPQRGDAKAAGSIPLANMAEKWSFEGLRRFLLDPLASRPSGRMPAIRLTDAEAADIAHYLLRDTRVPATVDLAVCQERVRSFDEIDTAGLARTGPADGFSVDANLRNAHDPLRFTGWLQVDRAGDYTLYFTATGASRLSVDGNWVAGVESWDTEKVDAKIPVHLDAGSHELKVDYVHRGDKPPAMKLEWEGPGIARSAIPASRLRADRDPIPDVAAFVVDATRAAAGRALYEKLNCAVCHDGKASANPAPGLAALNPTRGCLAQKPIGNSPDFHLDSSRRSALATAIGSLNQPNLPAPSPRQRVADTMAALKCTACHARDGVGGVPADRDAYFTSSVADTGDEGRLPPRLDGVGDKLRPAWIEAVLTQGAAVRQQLDTRMPQFGKENVGQFSQLFVAIDRKPATLAAVPDEPAAQKEAGRKIVGTDGLSCIACHRFNRQPAQTMQMIDLITTPDRLNEDWFRRFLRDPNRFHPGTRMPAFWPDGKSLLTTLLGGDIDRQHAALWVYLSDGPRAKFPEGLSRQGVELVVGGEAVVYRGKLWEAGFRAVAVGYPGQLNAAFDAEEMRLSLLWRGRFLNAGPHWQIQGMGQIRPLGTDVVVFQHGSPLAVLADANAPWPMDSSRELGMKFRGYQLDNLRRPTLLYSFGKLDVEDFLTPIEDAGKTTLHRSITFTGPPPGNLYLRLAVGKLTSRGENSWRLNDVITLTVTGAGKSLIRGKGDLQELLVPIQFSDEHRQLEVQYVW